MDGAPLTVISESGCFDGLSAVVENGTAEKEANPRVCGSSPPYRCDRFLFVVLQAMQSHLVSTP